MIIYSINDSILISHPSRSSEDHDEAKKYESSKIDEYFWGLAPKQKDLQKCGTRFSVNSGSSF